MAYPLDLASVPAIFLPGEAVSEPVPLGAYGLSAVVMPPVWTPAVLTWMVSVDGGLTWQQWEDGEGNPITHAVGPNVGFGIPSGQFNGVNMVMLRSGTFAAPVPQADGATITLQIFPAAV